MNLFKSIFGTKDQQKTEWPFEAPRDVAVFTTVQIMSQRMPILHVSHDEDDGAWQFHTGGDSQESDARILSLEEITKIDPTILELADLPEGWVADRSQVGDEWTRSKN
jgi:hypothetical protein